MNMSRESAIIKWCPFCLCMDGDDVGDGIVAVNCNHIERSPSWASCIADRCMAWQPTTGDNGYCGRVRNK